jgi:triosephosphate isomerase
VRKAYIAGNWKMNMTPSQAVAYSKVLKDKLASASCKVMIAPSFVCLVPVLEVLKGSNIIVAAQNMSNKEEGAYTGEVSVSMLKDAGIKTVILGHSERRSIYGETDAIINEKVLLGLKHGMELVLCVGETLEQRESGKAVSVVNDQVQKGLAGVDAAALKSVTIAYEPVWAIGTGKTATSNDADQIHKAIRDKITSLYSASAAAEMVIQYGGSVKPDNVKELMNMENIDGALVGGASLKIEQFEPIVKFDK